jgi:hypothetical protein
MIVLDTNVVSEVMRLDIDRDVRQWLDAQPRQSLWIASVSLLELRYGLLILPDGRRKTLLISALEKFLSEDAEGRVLAFDRLAAEQTAVLIAEHRRQGKGIERNDAMIAGTAMAHGAALATRNVRHFRYSRVLLVNPWEPTTRSQD